MVRTLKLRLERSLLRTVSVVRDRRVAFSSLRGMGVTGVRLRSKGGGVDNEDYYSF